MKEYDPEDRLAEEVSAACASLAPYRLIHFTFCCSSM